MNIFVLCTGRCGSMTFSKACSYINNFTSSHESRTHLLGEQRFNYPEKHIEVDNRLSWLLGRLEKTYGDDAYYVHLRRDDMQVASSYVKRYERGIMKAYRGGGIIMKLAESVDPHAVALDYCDTVNSNIEHFLRNKTNKMSFQLENAKSDFATFCDWINADVTSESALSEFDVKHNVTKDKPLI